mgnify:CR=1 FL=1
MSSVALSDVGQQRDLNEDAVDTLSIGESELLIVADGMGGHTAGEVASRCAIERISDYIKTTLDDSRTDYEAILEESIQTANEAIHARVESDSSLSGMGTTAVVALCVDNEAIIANVGDSRGYRICDEITQVTVDHSLVQQLVDAGEISKEEAKDHPQRNVVSQSLGNRVDIEPDIFRITVNGTILLCSDGLTEEVSDERIKEAVNDAPTIEDAADVLIQTANKNGGHDNISVALYSS